MSATKLDNYSVNNLRIPVDYLPSQDGISQSLLGDWQTCRRRFLFSINRWSHPAKERKTGYGSMNHELLDIIYSGFFFGDYKYRDLTAVIRFFLDRYQLPRVFSPQEQEQLKALSQAIMECYIEYYRADFTEFRLKAVEHIFEVKKYGWILRGKIDGCLADKTGAGWNLEHKNYSRINEESLQKRLSFDLQNLFYLNAHFIETGIQLKGVKYNILRKPEVKKFDRPIEMYSYVRGLISNNPDYYFIRYEIPYTKIDLKRFQDELAFKLNDLYECIKRAVIDKQNTLNIFYKNECACDQPYQCDFIDACASGKLNVYCRQKHLFMELGASDERPGIAHIKESIGTGTTTKSIVDASIKKARKLPAIPKKK